MVKEEGESFLWKKGGGEADQGGGEAGGSEKTKIAKRKFSGEGSKRKLSSGAVARWKKKKGLQKAVWK